MEGHGVSKDHLATTRWTDWYESVKYGYNVLQGMCDKIIVGGVSTGGAMTLRLASEYPVDGIISMASVTEFTNQDIYYIPVIKYLKSEHVTNLKDFEVGYYYDSKPSPAIEQLVKFSKDNKEKIKDITAPIIIIQSDNDTTAHPDSLHYIYDSVQSEHKEKVVIPGNLHVLTTSGNTSYIFDRIDAFLNELKNN